MPTKMDERTREATRVTWVGFFVNVLLSVIKMIAGIFGRSSALVADSIHSISDLTTDVAVLIGVRAASKPEDDTHRYGHGKIETLITLGVGVFLVFVGVGILIAAGANILAVINGEKLETPGIIAVVAAAISMVMKEGVYWYTRSVGRRLNSKALIANAWHHRTDSLSSLAAFIGVGAAVILGGKWAILDPITALGVTILIFWVSIKLIKESLNELIEGSLDQETEKRILKIAEGTNGVIDPHNLKTRSLGNKIAIDLHIKVDKDLTIKGAHDICLDLERSLRSEYGDDSVVNIHIDPDDV